MTAKRSLYEMPKNFPEVPKKKSVELGGDDSLGGMFGGNTLLYFFVGITAVSMGVSMFLYREVKNVKSSISTINNEIKELKEQSESIEENTNIVRGLDEKVNKMALMLQHSMMAKVPSPAPTKPPLKRGVPSRNLVSEKKELPSVEGVETKVSESGPFEDNEENDECEDGVCRIVPKKDGKILEI